MKELEHKNKNTGNNQQPTEQMIADRLARARVEAGSRFAEACDWCWYVNLCASISYPNLNQQNQIRFVCAVPDRDYGYDYDF
jgi:hypothetical protein